MIATETDQKNKVWKSWNENITHSYSDLVQVKSEKQLVKTILDAQKVRIFGAKTASSDISAGAETLIDISAYNELVRIDQENKRITVQSGIILSDLLDIIHNQGWCLPCLPDINIVTLGGAISTGTHGTAKDGKLLSSYMVGCRLVKANGEVLDITERDSDLLDAVRVSVGVLGVFSEITLQCEDDFTLEVHEGPMKDDLWLSKLDEMRAKNDFLRILFIPHAHTSYVIQGNKIDSQKEVQETKARPFLSKRRAWSKTLYSVTHKYPRFTVLANKILSKLFFRDTKVVKGNLYDATVTKKRGSTLELAEWTVPYSKFQELFQELRVMLNDPSTKTFIHIPMDVRFIKADESWLSYAYGEDIVTVGCVCRNTAEADSYYAFHTVEELFLKYGGRPHWAKRFKVKGKELGKLYPKWDSFLDLRQKMDPNEKFLNDYLKSVFTNS